MSRHFTLTDTHSLDDLQVFLARASRVEDGAVRLVADGSVLAVFTPVLQPVGLLDSSPTVLGLRTLRVEGTPGFDAVVAIGSLAATVEEVQREVTEVAAPVDVAVPAETSHAAWAAISPPRGGWVSLDPTDGALLVSVARAGIDEIALAIPAGTGEQIVHRARSEVWGRAIPSLEHVAAGAAFAAFALGFVVGDEEVRIFSTGPWLRLSTERGHVLTKRRVVSLLG